MNKIKIRKKIPTHGFSGSMIQQNFGEDPENHGFLFWDISKKIMEEINLPNDYAMINFSIKPGTDYDKLNLKTTHLARVNQFKVDWTEYAAYATYENETKIRKYLKEKYNATDIEIKTNRIYTDIKDGKMLSEVIDINNKQVQQDIIKKYLKENKFSEEFINKIINIDEIINSRLQLSEHKNILWNIDKFWFNNFKGYGDDNIIDWDKTKGIIQIAGENQMGKTTILDAICFILYGTTTSTQKIEKNGNNRYINKYRKLDFCDGGAVIDVNGEKYTMYRRVDRNSGKKGEIKSCPMTLEYYKGSEIKDEKKQTDENKIRTQKLLDGVLGDFQDFVRMSLTNADNLNNLLSMDKSVFIDGVIRDAGYDIFEKKLEEFKEWKKSLNLEKINLNESSTNAEILKLKNDLQDNETRLKNLNLEIYKLEEEINKNNAEKENFLRTLHKIDLDLIDLDSDKISTEIIALGGNIFSKNIEITKIEETILLLPENFDNEKFELYMKNYDKINLEKNKKKLELVETLSKIEKNNYKIKNVDKDIQTEKEKYLLKIESEISQIKNATETKINEIERNFSAKKSKIENKIYNLKNDILSLKKEGLKIKENLESYKNIMNDETSLCPTCNQPILNKNDNHIKKLIDDCDEKLKSILKQGKLKSLEIEENQNFLDELDVEKYKNVESINISLKEKIDLLNSQISNFNLDLIKENIKTIENNKELALIENIELETMTKNFNKFLEKFDIEIPKIISKIDEMKKSKKDFEFRKELQHKKNIIFSEIKDIQREIDHKESLLERFKNNLELIKENEEINNSITKIDLILKELKSKNNNMNNDRMSYSNQIVLYKKVIEDLETKLKLYKEQILIEELHDVYLKLVHRSGLPTYLLTKNIDLLNKELSNLLTNTNFNLFFDEDLNLKIQHDGKTGEINVIETSGMERTFSAIVLKIVLRIINFKSKSNIMFFDEIINRLVGKSVDKFLELLDILKEKIDKIIIIEHNNEIQSDLIISVTKNADGISVFELI